MKKNKKLNSTKKMPSTFTQMKRTRSSCMEKKDKFKLVELVKNHECIWDTSDAKHRNHIALYAAWREIAESLSTEVSVCKSTWASLRDSRRYRLKTGFLSDWEFGEALSFLPPIQNKETKLTRIDSADPLAQSQCGSSPRTHRHSKSSTPTSEILTLPSERLFITFLKKQIEMADEPKLKYMEQYSYLNMLLKDVPEATAADILFDVICDVRKKVKEIKAKK